jgi:Pentatricopeptide repeat domain
MRWHWSNTTRQILLSVIKPSRPGWIGHRLGTPLLRSSSIQSLSLQSYRSKFTSAYSTTAHTSPYPAAVQEKPFLPQELSTAQISRAAWKAVHLCLQTPVGGLEDAYIIVNSLRISSVRNDPRQSSQLEPDFASNTIDFGREISPRLSCHALLHGLLRIGLVDRASSLAMMMMETGIRLRRKTLEATFHAVLPPPQQHPQPTIPAGPFKLFQSQLSDLSSISGDEGTRAALLLLGAARNTHHGRTDGMYGTLLSICLINGEIILASLIFGLLVKDWQLKKSLAARLHESTCIQSDKSRTKGQVQRLPWFVFQTTMWMKQILSSINDILSMNGDSEAFRLSFASALQALAYLAVLLDLHHLPFANVSSLLSSLYNCPKVDYEVWIINRKGHPHKVKAYPYFHMILQRLVGAPTGKKIQKHMLYEFELDLPSLNSLLHYTLHHLHSPDRAEIILQHMKERQIQPDIVTHNTLLRSGTILRQDSIVRLALDALNQQFGPRERRMEYISSPEIAEEYNLVFERPVPESHGSLPEECVVPPSETPNLLEPDSHTINAYITYLTCTNRRQQVADLVFQMFPEIQPMDKALQAKLSPAQRNTMRKRARKQCVKRAVKFGPYVLTALLNALLKTGLTGLMKLVWRLSLRAERRSWGRSLVPEAYPWILPVHAYTIKLQCLRLEHKRPSMIPAPYRQELSPEQSRDHLLDVSIALYRFMKSRSRKAWGRIKSGTLPKLAPPLPDLRFFNTMLAPFVGSGRHERNMGHYRSNFRRAQRQHAQWGILPDNWNPMVQEVGEDIVQAGYGIPQGFRHLFIGRWEQGTWNVKRPPEFDRRPFAYPKRSLPSRPRPPFHIPVRREKGLHRRRNRQFKCKD